MFYLLCLLLCLTAGQTNQPNQTQTAQPIKAQPASAIVKQTITSGGRQRTFYLFVPANAASDKPAPLVVLLHPSGGNGQYLIKRWQDLASREGFLLAGPDALNTDHWSAPVDGPDFLRDVVEAVRTEHALDRRRVYLFGFSAGSGFAINMSLLQSEYFAATAAFASVNFKEQFAEMAARKIPFSFTVGVQDEIFSIADARAGRDGLRAHGFPVEWKEIANAGHDYATYAAAVNQAAWEFFKQHELAADPQYRDYQFMK